MSTLQDAERLAREAVDHTYSPSEPQPLFRAPRAAAEFPLEALPEELRSGVEAIQRRTQAPYALCAHAVLGAAALAVQAHADVELPTGEINPTSLFLMTIAESGERKSACDNLAQRGIVQRERELREAYDEDDRHYKNSKEAWEKARAEATGAKLKGVEAKRHALDQLGAEPQRPLPPLLTVDEPTLEGLVKLFQYGHPSLGLFAGEAASFLGGHGMTDDAKARMAAGLTLLWDGKPLRRVRAGESTVLPGRRLSVHLMAQPAVAALLLCDPLIAGADGQGLVNRFLIAAPESTAGGRFFEEPPEGTDDQIQAFARRCRELLGTRPALVDGKANELAPRILRLNPAARQAWIAYQHATEAKLGPDGELRPIRGLANRLPAHACRLAAVLTLFSDLHVTEIGEEDMTRGIALAEYYGAEALRQAEWSAVNADLRLADLVLRWCLHAWKEEVISLPDLYQLGPNSIRAPDLARRIVGVLVKYGHLSEEPGPIVVNGKRRREAWRIIGKQPV